MTFSSCLTEEDRQLVMDSSVVINLLASGVAESVLSALDARVFLPESVVHETEYGEKNCSQNAAIFLSDILAIKSVEIVELDGVALETFTSLVSGPSSATLGDGEAATIALALRLGGSAVIDEKKATGIVTRQFASLRLSTTVDVLSHHSVVSALGEPALGEALFAALRDARMQVREHQFDWVSSLIGQERVAQCSSLRRLSARRAQAISNGKWAAL